MTPSEYYEKFKDLLVIAEWLGTNIGKHPDRIEEELKKVAKDPNNPTNDEHKKATEWVKERYLAITFPVNSHPKRCARLLVHFENEYTWGSNKFPKTIVSAYEFIMNNIKEKYSDTHINEGIMMYNERDKGGRGQG